MKREKHPPLKTWQLEVVKKHETRRRLLNGSPFDRAKYWFIQMNKISEEEFDLHEREFTKTFYFQKLRLREGLIDGINEFANAVRGIFNGGQR